MSSHKKYDNQQKTEGDSSFARRNVFINLADWNEARVRLGVFGSVSDVIRKLLRLWLDGKINLDDYYED